MIKTIKKSFGHFSLNDALISSALPFKCDSWEITSFSPHGQLVNVHKENVFVFFCVEGEFADLETKKYYTG